MIGGGLIRNLLRHNKEGRERLGYIRYLQRALRVMKGIIRFYSLPIQGITSDAGDK